MLAVPVVDIQGKRQGEMSVDPELLGGQVRASLLKQAIVAFLDRQRQRSARTKRKSDVEGSTRKLYRQKGTGNARMGQIRTPIRRGGGRAFGRRIPGRVKELPRAMRRLARANAVLAKLQAEDVLILDGLSLSQPKTKTMAGIFAALGAERGCLLAVEAPNANVHLSCRNLPRSQAMVVDDLNAYAVLRRKKLVFTKPAFERFTASLAGLPWGSGGRN